MAKRTATNIVEVWNWLINVLEGGELSATEQAVLVHIIAKLNRSMWTPTKINAKLIAAAVSKDARTVKSAIEHCVEAGILTTGEEGYFIEDFKATRTDADNVRSKFQFGAGTNSGDTNTPAGMDNSATGARANTNSASVAEGTAHSSRRRKLFKSDDVS